MAALRVAIADDSALIRAGVSRVLADAGFEIVGEAADGDELVRIVEATHPDVAVVDIRMPPTNTDEGIRAARLLRARHPGTGVVVLSQYAEPHLVEELLEDGADGIGYLLKDRIADVGDFAAAVRRVAGGGSALDPAVVEVLVARSAGRRVTQDATAAMEQLMIEHAAAWARGHGCGVARQVGDEFVAVLPDGRHSRHAHFYEALDWLDAQGAPGR